MADILGFSRRKERKAAMAAQATQEEVALTQKEGDELHRFESRIEQLKQSFDDLRKEMKRLKKLRKHLLKSQEKKVVLLRKDIQIRRRLNINESGKHIAGDERKELRYLKKRAKLVKKETRSLSELDADLVVLHETAQKFDKSLRDIHSEYVVLMQELNLEATELKRAA